MNTQPKRRTRTKGDSWPLVKRTTTKLTTRTDHILLVEKRYEGDIHSDPAAHNALFAELLRELADELGKIGNQWADPEIVVWTHVEGKITAQLSLSPPVKLPAASKPK